jgi:hypothetical protein
MGMPATDGSMRKSRETLGIGSFLCRITQALYL